MTTEQRTKARRPRREAAPRPRPTARPSPRVGVAKLRRQLDLYRQILAHSTEAIGIIDLEGRYIEQNAAHLDLLGFTDDDLRDRTPALHLGDETFARVAGQLARTGRFQGELLSRRKDGRVVPIELSAFAVKDEAGRPLCYAGLKRNIETRRVADEKLRQSLREKEVLLKEVNHRVKNNLQVVSSLLSLQSLYIVDPTTRELFRDSQNRIRAMALIHESLYESADLAHIDVPSYLDRLGQAIFRSYGVDTARIKLDVQVAPVSLALDTAVPFGLIVNELVSNALKYAFPDRAQGRITIGLVGQGDGGWELTVADDGVGLPPDIDPAQVKSLGLHLVSSLTDQLTGTLSFERGPGARFTLKIPDQQRRCTP